MTTTHHTLTPATSRWRSCAASTPVACNWLDPAAQAGMQAALATVQRIVDEDQVVYGINTGFGKLASTKIAHERLAELQRNLVLSHSVGTGEALPDGVVRLVLATKAVSLARGHSGIRPEIVDALLALANANVLPVIPAKGSVGASGDLAPLAHMACVLIGEGQAKVDGKVVPGKPRPWPPWACSPLCSAPRKGWRCSTARRCPRRWRWPACLARRRVCRRAGGRAPVA
jgi:histidine ammonia-lyase